MASAAGRALPVVTDAERAVANLLPIKADRAAADSIRPHARPLTPVVQHRVEDRIPSSAGR